jgi:superfamily I DNA and/or RNA helicase
VLSRDVLTAATRLPDRFVLGGTAKAFHKHQTLLPSFDMLVLDEASQVTFGELSLLLPLLKDGGKLVFAGDDLQLPPIWGAGEKECVEEGDDVQDSVFGWLRRRDLDGPSSYTCQLLENWRMNATLSRFSAETLYGRGYRPANPAVADRRIRLAPASSSDPFIEEVLSPDHPLTVVVIEEVRASLKNRAEAALVAEIASALRESMLAPDGDAPYPDNRTGDEEFWRRGLFIVSPHHAQIGAIRNELAKCRTWKSDPFVETVEKMQGQQCEAVIVSYGVSDHETALREAEFIYSRNRLNVSVTRARAKCIVFLPRPLLEPSFELLQNERAAEGLRHMLDLIAFCRREGEKKAFTLEGAGRVTVFRAAQPD